MFKGQTAFLIIYLIAASILSQSLFAQGRKHKDISQITGIGPEEAAEFDRRVDALIASGFEFIKPRAIAQTFTENVVREVIVDTLGKTTFDLGWNILAGTQIRLTDDVYKGAHMAFMWRTTDANSSRYAAYNYYDRQAQAFSQTIEPGFIPLNRPNSGWPRVANGAAGVGLYAYHHVISIEEISVHFRRDDYPGNATFSTDVVVSDAAVWPGIDAHGTTVIISAIDNVARSQGNVIGRTFVSHDHGDTWTDIGWPSLLLPNMTEGGNVETQPLIDPDGTSVSFVNMEDDANSSSHFVVGNGGIVLSQSDDLNANTNWTTSLIYKFKELLPNNSFYDPFALGNSAFSSYHAEIDENGVVHVIFNAPGTQLDGSGEALHSIHAVAYWNSADQQLIELNDPVFRSSPALADSIDFYFPGAGWGLSYPHITTGPGGHVLAAWTQPELLDSVALNYVFGESGGVPSVKRYSTDIYAAYSKNSGQTWSLPFKLIGNENVVELFPQLAELEIVNDSVHVNILYLWDTNPGGSVSGESDISICPWIYKALVIDPQFPVGINATPGTVPGMFKLAQNYPNPFNPETTISFTLEKADDVTLAVFNISGQKVATLFSGRKNAGEHHVTFQGKNFSSGVYLYRLSNGAENLSRKMVLLK